MNVTTGGALTGVASIDTISVSATALGFAGVGTLSAGATGLNLQGDGAIDVNLAGGSTATGCTVTNSNGNLACSGTITANGTLLTQYWSRDAATTTLYPAADADKLTLNGLLTATAGATLAGAVNINTTGTANTAIGNAAGTFALASSGGLNVTTGGALTGVASIDTISTSATAIGFAGLGGITSAAGTDLSFTSGTTGTVSVDSGTSGAVNLGTGNTAKTINIGTGTGGDNINIGTNNTTADTIAVGSALDSFALTSTGLNVTTGGALTGVASIDTISVSATALGFAGVGTLSAGATGLNLQGDGAIDVNLAGGSTATGCTVTNSNGNLACSGTITANGTLLTQYWSRDAATTTLYPAADADKLTLNGLLTATAGATLAGAVNINTTGTANTAIGNAAGTFALTSSGGLNVTTGGALTGVASIDTISTSATALGFAGLGGITSAAGTDLSFTSGTTGTVSVDSGTSGAVNLGTGNTAKTINIGTGTGGDNINIGTNNTTADTIAVGSALDSFALTSTGLNVTTGGALTGVASIDTISVSATALGFAGVGTLSAGATGLNLQGDGAIDVNLAGGSTATGCTVTNSNGNLACSGTFTLNGVTSGYVSIKSPASPTSYTLTLPSAVPGVSGQALISDTSGNLSWSSVPTGNNPWDLSSDGKAIIEKNTTMDLLIGGSATSSATFAVTSGTGAIKGANGAFLVNSSGNITAAAATLSGNLTFSSAATIATTSMQDLTIGNTNTGIIKIGNQGLGYSGGATVSGALRLDDVYGVQGAGLINCNDPTEKLLWDSTSKRFSCGTNVGEVRSFTDTTTDTLDNTDNTEYWDAEADNPNIQLASSADRVMVQVSVIIANNANNQDIGITIRRDSSTSTDDADCDDTLIAQDITAAGSDTGSVPVITAIFIDNPGVTTQTAYTVCSSDETTGVTGSIERIDMILSEVGVASDLAEVYSTNDSDLTFGEIVSINPLMTSGIQKTTSAYDSAILGVVSTRPAKVIGGVSGEGSSGMPIAVTGRTPVKVTSINGPVASGDGITSSYFAGYGMKSTKSGMIIGRAMQGTEYWNDTYCPTVDSLAEADMLWPYDSGNNDAKPCVKIPTSNLTGVPSSYTEPYVYFGKVMMFIEKGFDTPNKLINNNSSLFIDLGADIPGIGTESASLYMLHDGLGNILENEGAFSGILAANATMGAIFADTITSASISADLLHLGDIDIGESGGIFSFSTGVNPGLFSLDMSGNATISGTLTTSGGNYDIAEDYPTLDGSIEAGDILSVDQVNIGYVQKSSKAYDSTILGIYSEKPGFRLSQLGSQLSGSRAVPVALAGRVPVKVSAEAGPINKGDYLTSSSLPGIAMKANRAGQALGKALEDFDCNTPDFISPQSATSCQGKIMAFVNISYADPDNLLANVAFDDEGKILVSNISASSIALPPNLYLDSQLLTGTLADALTAIGDTFASQSAKLSELDLRVGSIETNEASKSAQIAGTIDYLDLRIQEVEQTSASGSAVLSQVKDLADNLTQQVRELLDNNQKTSLLLTSPEILISTASADLADISSVSSASLSGELSAYSLIAGSISSPDIAADGTLYLQSSPLANLVNIFNGAVTIDKSGTIRTIGNVNIAGSLNIEGAITSTALAGEDIKAKDAVYISSSGVVKKADATDPGRIAVIGIAANDAPLDSEVIVISGGRAKGFTNLETGRRYYLGPDATISPIISPESVENISMGIAFSDTELVMQIAPTLVIDTGNVINSFSPAQTVTAGVSATESATTTPSD